jgi:dipeptidyl aminopeptidase/acylaminoacyl peptidase
MFYATDEIFFAKAEYCKKDNIDCNPFEEGARENMFKWAPETLVNNWSTPMMVIHGGKDYRVSLSEGLGVFTSLRLKNIESKMLFFPEENHWVLKPENQIKWMEEVIAWFDKYAKKN